MSRFYYTVLEYLPTFLVCLAQLGNMLYKVNQVITYTDMKATIFPIPCA